MTQRSVPASRSTQVEPAICQPTVSAIATTMRLTPIVMWIHFGRLAEESWPPTLIRDAPCFIVRRGARDGLFGRDREGSLKQLVRVLDDAEKPRAPPEAAE